MNNAKYTHKTRDGRLARIVSTDTVGNYPIVALVFDQNNNSEFAISLTKNLKEFIYATSNLDLVPYSVWEDVPVDTKVFVKNFEDNKWIPRHFSHFENDYVFTFVNGATSFTSNREETTYWRFAKLAQ